ncbi:hypothetical protein ALTERO38_50633 [Alteromonas sp. 38]|nr:hypothetical protein ALTER154_80635 [Alteromonas sp. 154]VXB41823.1 hypothetical protein ALTERO38_50633 [Alteromonas sp. 38]
MDEKLDDWLDELIDSDFNTFLLAVFVTDCGAADGCDCTDDSDCADGSAREPLAFWPAALVWPEALDESDDTCARSCANRLCFSSLEGIAGEWLLAVAKEALAERLLATLAATELEFSSCSDDWFTHTGIPISCSTAR